MLNNTLGSRFSRLSVTGIPRSGENIWNFFFQIGQKSGNFVDDQGNLERPWKVREFENKWLWQAVLRKLFILFKREKEVHSHERV